MAAVCWRSKCNIVTMCAHTASVTPHIIACATTFSFLLAVLQRTARTRCMCLHMWVLQLVEQPVGLCLAGGVTCSTLAPCCVLYSHWPGLLVLYGCCFLHQGHDGQCWHSNSTLCCCFGSWLCPKACWFQTHWMWFTRACFRSVAGSISAHVSKLK